MAILHVSASGSNTSPYETWAKAATDIQTVDSLTGAGDTIYLSSAYVSGYSASTTLTFVGGTFANPVRLISADETTGAPTDGDGSNYLPGADLTTSSGTLTFTGADLRVWGVDFTTSGSADLTLNNSNTGDLHEYHDSVMTTVDNHFINGVLQSHMTFNRCSFIRSGASAEGIEFAGSDGLIVRFTDCSWTKGSGIDQLIQILGTNQGRVFLFYGCDVSDFSVLLNAVPTGGSTVLFQGCEVASGVDLLNGTLADTSVLTMEACNNGTIAAPALGVTEIETAYGVVSSSLAQYRTGGANDGQQANAHSWSMVSSANVLEFVNVLVSPPIVVWTDGGSEETYTIFVASGITFQDDELWMQLEGPSPATSTSRRHVVRSNDTTAGSQGMSPLDTPTNLTTDSVSTWNGTGVGTLQEMSITYTPGIAGPVTIRVFLAKASSTVYIDPKIDVS